MRWTRTLPLMLCLLTTTVYAQESPPAQATLTVRSTLVNVPALVKTSGGEVVFELTADDFNRMGQTPLEPSPRRPGQ